LRGERVDGDEALMTNNNYAREAIFIDDPD
jgi:hypothetical protein